MLIVFLLNNKIISSSNLDGTGRSLKSPGVVDRLVGILTTETNNLTEQHARLNTDRQELTEKRRQVRQIVDPRELVRLNVGGRIFVTRRETLTKVPKSILAKVFDGSYGATLQRDTDGSYFLDYNPTLFSHLLDQLRVMKINVTTAFRPPSSSSSSSTRAFNQMLQDLGLGVPKSSENDVIALNVGGERIVTLRKTLGGVPDSNLALLQSDSKAVIRDRFGRPFLDYNPTMFRHLLDQLREGKKINDQNLQAPANGSQTAFQAMLNALGVPSK